MFRIGLDKNRGAAAQVYSKGDISLGCDASILLDSEGSEIVSSMNFALVARESAASSGGPEIQIPLGRKDSRTSNHQQADIHLPSSGISVDEFLHIFMSKGMNLEESVAILDSQIINHSFELLLKLECPTKTPLTNLTVVPNDMTPFIFYNHYYRDVVTGKGVFGIDSESPGIFEQHLLSISLLLIRTTFSKFSPLHLLDCLQQMLSVKQRVRVRLGV
ncbi:hypothetical protein Ddye_019734 [Dipteronia dyeriana]|uniref:peroxidase n=1 Tax=Dipteronia dyeriana TaxID=168575 RepID=A0AAD9TZE7_9ROSI|nr:hypothetical protein Ddye_019734 [Dipteronia dyeriana]